MICNRCKVDKPIDDFIHGKAKCRECYKKCREYYQANREACIARAMRAINKDRLITNRKKRENCRKHPVTYILGQVRNRAKNRGIPFNLTREDIVIPKVCPILGLPLHIGTGGPAPDSPSLDRIDPKYGYIKGNVHVISHRANTIKSDATVDELKKLITYLEQMPRPELNGAVEFTKISRYINKNNKTVNSRKVEKH